MDKQMSLSALSDELAQVRTKKKDFLAQIDRIIPWGEWIALIRPCYYKGERGNKPYGLERIASCSSARICASDTSVRLAIIVMALFARPNSSSVYMSLSSF